MFRSERFKTKVYIDIRNNNTSSNTNKAIMSSQNTMAKESYPYKIIQCWLCSLIITQNIHIMHNPDFSQAFVFMLYLFKPFNFHAIHEREPCTQHYRWNRIWWLWRRQKEGDSLTSTRHINGLWRCQSIDINVGEQGLTCNGCTRAISL